MERLLIRVRLPDRPGALGAVASRIGAVGGSVTSIDVLESGGGDVIDELGVEIDSGSHADLLRSEILEVDGVEVESMDAVAGSVPDRNAEALELAISLFHQRTPAAVIDHLVAQVRASLSARYAVVLDPRGPWPDAVAGDLPDETWLADAAVRVAQSAPRDATSPPATDLVPGAAVARLPRAGLVLLVGRESPVLRRREYQRVAVMAELADHRWEELATRAAAG